MNIEGYSALTIYEVESLHTLFLGELHKSDDVVLDFSTIEKIDMVGIQLLLSFKKSLEASDRKITFTNIEPSLREHIMTCQYHEVLGINHD